MPTGNIGIFGTRTRTDTLLAIHMLGETHASELAKVLGKSLSRIQAAVESLERAGLVAGTVQGNNRRLTLSSRFVALPELTSFLNRLAILDTEMQARLATLRRRPRRSGKPL